MKNWLKQLISKTSLTMMVNAVAICLVVQNVEAACTWALYQPDVPESAKKLIK